MVRSYVAALVLLPLTNLVSGPSVAGAVSESRKVELILDASGSMNGRLPDGEVKLAAARKAIEGLLGNMTAGTTIAFRAYGHQSPREKHDCRDTQLLVPFGSLEQNGDPTRKQLGQLKARGYTPITWVIETAAKDFEGTSGVEKVLILVSDGNETCEGDPCAAAETLKKSDASLVIHTVGFGVDEATRAQLECVAARTGGKYFSAEDSLALGDVLSAAVETAGNTPPKRTGSGRLKVDGADLAGHRITDATTGSEVGNVSRVHSTIDLPAGIYNLEVGKSVWKSVEVKDGETTVLRPGRVTVDPAALRGHSIVHAETGVEHALVSALNKSAALMPGTYQVLFGPLEWQFTLDAGEQLTLRPGTVQVRHASYRGHAVRNAAGMEVGQVSNTGNWIPLPPGEYSVDLLNGTVREFTLKEGDEVVFDAP